MGQNIELGIHMRGKSRGKFSGLIPNFMVESTNLANFIEF